MVRAPNVSVILNEDVTNRFTCDQNDFNGELSEKEYIININAQEIFNASYEIELV